jgi:hypothetical protein
MLPLALILSFLASPPVVQARIDAALYVSAVAWGHDPALYRGLAEVESGCEANPRRYGRLQRWGNPPLGRRWSIVGLMQLPAGKVGMGGIGRIPDGELLILLPELAAWYGAGHLAGWRRACGAQRQWDCYNRGWDGRTAGTWGRQVKNAARRK